MPHLPWSVRRRRRVLPPVGLLVLMAALVLPILGLTVLDAGPVAAGLGTFFALLPVLPVVGVFLWIDRWEPEPGRLLVTAFLWGAGVSTVAALVTSLALDIAWMRVAGVEVGNVAGTVVTAPVVEEAAKGLFLVILLAIKRRELDGIVDGIVYAGFVGVGFAFTENILYLGTAFAQGGLHGGVMLFGMRCVLSPFAHPLFTSMTGLAVGAMARSRGRVKWALPIVGYLGAVLLHGLWNLSASLVDGSYFFAVYVVVMVPLFVAMAAVVVWQRRREQRIVATQLPQFVARGWVRPEEVRLLTTLHSRATWRAEVKRRFGPAAAKAVRDYQTAITELAFLHERLSRGAAGSEAESWLTDLLNGMNAARARLLHSHPAVLTA
jgi:RsiW-degrading membrane proteinase PrsW (M82 family)